MVKRMRSRRAWVRRVKRLALRLIRFAERIILRLPGLGERERMVRYALMGGIGVLAQLSMLALLVLLGVQKDMANLLAIETGILTSFMGQRSYTFQDRKGSFLRQILQFHAFTLLGVLVQMLVFILLTDHLLGHDALWKILMSSLLGLLAGFMVNYPLNKHITFRDEKR